MFNRFAISACAAILVSPCPALAADDPAAVVVTATRFKDADPGVAANISVITRQDIRNTPATNLPDVLATRAGVDSWAAPWAGTPRSTSAASAPRPPAIR
jgi:iron complex outermembrane receptor protein